MAAGKHFKTSEDGALGSSNPSNRTGASRSQQDLGSDGYPPQTTSPRQDAFETIQMDDHATEYVRVRHRRRSKKPLIAAAVVGVVLLAVVAGAGLFASQAYSVYGEAKEVLEEVDAFQDALTDGDADALRSSAEAIEELAGSMAATVDNPLWAVASALPVVGTDIANARAMVGVLEDLATRVVSPLADQADSLNLGSVFEDGAINVELVGALAQLVQDVAPAVSEAAETVSSLDEGSIDKVNAIIERVDDTMATLDALCSGLAELAPYLEDMLGANGTRTYLILAHSTTELKSSGGFIGSAGTLSITNGVFELGDFGTLSATNRDATVSRDEAERAYVTDEEAALFTWTYGLHTGDSGVNPDFTREGEMVTEMWESYYGDQIDGVIALDTQVLAYFLGLTGSVTTSDGLEVTAENCVELLGHDIYWQYFSGDAYDSTSNPEADALFAEVAGLAFKSVVQNISSASLTGLAEVLVQATGEYRLLLWMEDADEEAALDALGVSGAISDDESAPVLGVFIESRRSSKLDWWTLLSTSWELAGYSADGGTTYAVTTTISNTITAEEVSEASTYICGSQEGTNQLAVYLYAPAGGTIADIEVEGGTITGDVSYHTINGIEVGKVTISIDPESTATITYTVTTSAAAESELTLRTTPTAQSAG